MPWAASAAGPARSPGRSASTGRPSRLNPAISSCRRPLTGCGPGGCVSRRTAASRRSAVSVSSPVRAANDRASVMSSGRAPPSRRAASTVTTTEVRWWALTSCSSLARRCRSVSAACLRSSSARASRPAAAHRPPSHCRRASPSPAHATYSEAVTPRSASSAVAEPPRRAPGSHAPATAAPTAYAVTRPPRRSATEYSATNAHRLTKDSGPAVLPITVPATVPASAPSGARRRCPSATSCSATAVTVPARSSAPDGSPPGCGSRATITRLGSARTAGSSQFRSVSMPGTSVDGPRGAGSRPRCGRCLRMRTGRGPVPVADAAGARSRDGRRARRSGLPSSRSPVTVRSGAAVISAPRPGRFRTRNAARRPGGRSHGRRCPARPRRCPACAASGTRGRARWS
ncbi:hypothetical protein SFUMM280S_02287 [Streptomyces fumanus]